MALKNRVIRKVVRTRVSGTVKDELETKTVPEIIRGVMIPVAQSGRAGRRGTTRELLKEISKEIKVKHRREHKGIDEIVKDYTDTDGFMELWGILGFTEEHLRTKVAEVVR